MFQYRVKKRYEYVWYVTDRNRQISQKRRVFAGQIYSTTCVESAGNHSGLSVM